MVYNISYDICAFFVSLAILFLHRGYRNAPLLQNKRFANFTFSIMIYAVIDTIYHICISHLETLPVWLVSISCYAFFIVMLMPEYRFMSYTLSLSEMPLSNVNKFEKICLYFPLSAVVIIALTNPLHQSLFIIADGEVKKGYFAYVIYLVTLFYLIYGLIVTLRCRKYIDKLGRTANILYVSIIFICVFIQLLFPYVACTSFGSSLGLLLMFLTIQRPQSYIDSITGLLNKEIFTKYYNIKSCGSSEFYIIFVYIEDLKLANEAIGISSVNKVLREVSHFLEVFAPKRTFYLGASTFALVAYTSNKADYIIGDIDKRFSEPWYAEDSSINLSFRVLKLCCPDDVFSTDTLFSYTQYLADLKNTRDKWVFTAADMNIKSASRELAVEGAIKRAIEEKSFTMYYQPIVSTHTRKIVSAEALIRLVNDQLGFIPPSEFIPIAERNGSILKIGEIIFEKVFQFMSEKQLHNLGVDYIEINLSVIQCLQENFGNKIVETMKNYNIENGRINLEITETAAAFQSRALFKNIKYLTENNISISLDDFGSGYSNMNSILDLPLDMVKIDKHMIDMADTAERGKVVLASSVAMIKNMDMKIVAEGIERKEQLDSLTNLGVDYIQGYYFSRPLPGEDFVKFVTEFNQGGLSEKYFED